MVATDEIERLAQEIVHEQHVDAHLARRVAAVRKGDKQRALELLTAYQTLDAEYGLLALTFADVKPQLQTERIIVPYTASEPVNVLVFNVHLHKIGQFAFADEVRIIAWYLDQLSRRDQPDTNLVLLINLAGAAYAQLDSTLMRRLLNLLQSHVPVRICQVVLCNVPWWASIFVRISLALLSSKLADKITLANSMADLLAHVPAKTLPRTLGGSLAYDHSAWLQQQEQPHKTAADTAAPTDPAPQPQAVPAPQPQAVAPPTASVAVAQPVAATAATAAAAAAAASAADATVPMEADEFVVIEKPSDPAHTEPPFQVVPEVAQPAAAIESTVVEPHASAATEVHDDADASKEMDAASAAAPVDLPDADNANRLRSLTKNRVSAAPVRRAPTKRVIGRSTSEKIGEDDDEDETPEASQSSDKMDAQPAAAVADDDEPAEAASFAEKKAKIAQGSSKSPKHAKVIRGMDPAMLKELAEEQDSSSAAPAPVKSGAPVGGVKLFGDIDPSKVKLKKRAAISEDMFSKPASVPKTDDTP